MAFVRNEKHSVSKKFRGGYTDYRGKQVQFTGTTSKQETLAMARRKEDEHRQIRLGYRPIPKVSDKPRTFAEVAAQYIAHGKAQGGHGGRPWSPIHVATRVRHLETFWPENLRGKMLQDVTREAVERVALKLLEKKKSGKTVQAHVESIKSLCLYAKELGYLEENPLEGIKPIDTTPKDARRAMTHDEIDRLFNAAPPERRLVYAVAICTGYRKGELAALRVKDLNVETCTLSLTAEFCKGRRDSRQPIPERLALTLKADSESKADGDRLLKVSSHIDRYFFNDLTAAKIDETTTAGKLVFHSLRHTFCSLVIESGASITEAQRLARHLDPKMTDRYSHARKDRLQSTAEAVGEKVLNTRNTALLLHRPNGGADNSAESAVAKGDYKNDDQKGARVRCPSPASENQDTSRTLPAQNADSLYDGAKTSDLSATVSERKADTSPGDFTALILHPTDPDFAKLAALWQTMPAHIRAAIMALAATVNP